MLIDAMAMVRELFEGGRSIDRSNHFIEILQLVRRVQR